MKTDIKNNWFSLLIALLFLVTPAIADDANNDKTADMKNLKGMTITLANGEYAPFFSENLKHYGVVSRIVKEAFAQENINVRYVFRPWKRGMEEAAKGKWNGTVGWLKTEARLNKFYYSIGPIMSPKPVFFQRKDSPVIWDTISDLKDIKIGFTSGYSYGGEFKKAEDGGEITIVRCVDTSHCFKMLINGRIDLAAAEFDVGLNILNSEFTPEDVARIEPQSKSLHSKELFLLLSRNIEENVLLIELFDKGLRKLQISGKVEQFWMESRRGKYIKK